MKKLVLNSVLLMALSACGIAEAGVVVGPAQPLVTRTYTASTIFEPSLDINDYCLGPNPARLEYAEHGRRDLEPRATWVGYRAFQKARDMALSTCLADANPECYVESAFYEAYVSPKWIGYKGCKVTLVVRGTK